jgi:hypothetical protein
VNKKMSYAEEKKTAYELIEKLAAKEAYTPDEIVFNVSRITGLGTLCLKRFISDGILHKLFYVNNQGFLTTINPEIKKENDKPKGKRKNRKATN